MNAPASLILSLLALTHTAGSGHTQGFDFQAMAAYSDARVGHAILVTENDQVLFEHYANGWSDTMAHRLASGTKSFTGVLLAMAVDDGLLTFDEPVSQTITEWLNDQEPRNDSLTYRQLVGLVSGLWGGIVGTIPTYAQSISSPMIDDPGIRFDYGPNPFQVFGEALKRKLAATQPSETLSDYLLRKLITPLGMNVAGWADFASGDARLPSGALLTAREWVKFGHMVRDDGLYQGRRLVSEANLLQCFVSTAAARDYGVGWWLPGPRSLLPSDLRMAKGAGDQRLYVWPSRNIVIVRFGESVGNTFSDVEFLSAMMPSRYTDFGQGCAGTAGTPILRGDPNRLPAYGRTLALGVANLPQPAVGAFFLGLSNTNYFGLPLPFDMTGLGATGCPMDVSLDFAVGFASGTGFATLVVPIPDDDSLPGQVAYFQAVLLDPLANAAGFVVSNGVEVTIGLR
ncbi:MAG: serine hydrolase [Planctomycetes bacterium]|nr:serine hydrolase [Planctomycetota bacterium]MCB9891788.1 serine hydrolase [Planctomycetota bacterium]